MIPSLGCSLTLTACPGYLVGALVTQAKATMEAKMKKQHSYGYGYSPYQGYGDYSSYQAPSYQAATYQAQGNQANKYHGSYYEYSRRNGYSLNTEH